MEKDESEQAATDAVHSHLVESQVRPRVSATDQGLLRSQGGPLSGVPFSYFPTSALARFDSTQFRVMLLRRLWLPLPPSSRNCQCGRLLDVLGDHRAACAEAGVLGRRGFALESAAARVSREAGARVGTNILTLVPRNDESVHREEDGAVRFDDLASIFRSEIDGTSHWSIRAWQSFLA